MAARRLRLEGLNLGMRLVLLRPWRYIAIGTRATIESWRPENGVMILSLDIDGDPFYLSEAAVRECWEPDWVVPGVEVTINAPILGIARGTVGVIEEDRDKEQCVRVALPNATWLDITYQDLGKVLIPRSLDDLPPAPPKSAYEHLDVD